MPKANKINVSVSVLSEADRERIEELTGEKFTTLAAALDQWDREREALATFNDDLQAMGILLKRLIDIIETPKKIIDKVYKEMALFLPPKTREAITIYLQEYEATNKVRKMSRGLIHDHKAN